MEIIVDQVVALLTGGRPNDLLWVVAGLSLTLGLIYMLGGRTWAMIYFLTIPFLNWSFGVVDPFCLVRPLGEADPLSADITLRRCAFEASGMFRSGVELHPLTLVTGLVFVFRDFVQRAMGQWVLVVMALAIAWSFYYAWPVIALASGIAFAVSETVDWLLFTFTKYRLSTRILLSSLLASPVDTTIFLFGADLAVRMNRDAQREAVIAEIPACQVNAACEALATLPPLEPGTMLHAANWIVFFIGKMVGAVIVSAAVRRREETGLVDARAL